MKHLTSRQQQILEWIHFNITHHGMPPTRADICTHFNFNSPTAAEDHLKALARKGFIELVSGSSRGIRLVNTPFSTRAGELPLIGRVAAGQPILAEQHVETYFSVDANSFKPRADYLLTVRGHSMKDVGIMDGDLLAVHRTHKAQNKQIVVARWEDEVTVKRFMRRGKRVTLMAENTDYENIVLDLEQTELVIEGLGVGVIRQL